MSNNFDDDEDPIDYNDILGINKHIREEQVIPVMRVYISFVKENQDMLDIPDAVNLLCQNNKSPSENIKELIDKGMINIYACCFNNVHKVI